MATYRATVEYKGRPTYTMHVDAAEAILACEVAERQAAMMREGSLDNLPDYFTSHVSLVTPPAVRMIKLGDGAYGLGSWPA